MIYLVSRTRTLGKESSSFQNTNYTLIWFDPDVTLIRAWWINSSDNHSRVRFLIIRGSSCCFTGFVINHKCTSYSLWSIASLRTLIHILWYLLIACCVWRLFLSILHVSCKFILSLWEIFRCSSTPSRLKRQWWCVKRCPSVTVK